MKRIRMSKVLQHLSSYAGLLVYGVLAAGSLALRFQSGVAIYVLVAILSLAVLNTSIAMRRAGYMTLASVYSVYTLSFALLTLVFYNPLLSPFSSLVVGMAIIFFAFIVVVLTQHLYSYSTHSILTTLTPATVLASVILGIYIGLPNPLICVASAIIDAISSAIIISAEKRRFAGLAMCLLAFAVLYSQPLLGFRIATLAPILLLHVVRNLALAFGKPLYAKSVHLLDIALRPVVVWLL
uniref:Uncharacterized protein n=1 Tax=Ignisphaera aggregans TaxID=334771 RepID=A0A7C4FHS3_9CREN